MKVVGLETHTFDIGNVKHTTKYQKSVEAKQSMHRKSVKAINELSLWYQQS